MDFIISFFISCIIAVVCYWVGNFFGRKESEDAATFFFVIFYLWIIFMIIAFIVLPIVNYINHIHDCAIINKQNVLIEIQENRVSELIKIFNEIKLKGNVVVNADSPIESISREISMAIKELADQQSIKASAIISIEERRMSIYGFIIKLLPIEVVEVDPNLVNPIVKK